MLVTINLTEEEKANPLEVVRDFFQSCHLLEIQATLWKMVETSILSETLDKAKERSHLLWFYRELGLMLEASSLLCQRGIFKEEKRPLAGRAYKEPFPKWKTKADLENEIKALRIESAERLAKLLELSKSGK